MAQLRSPASHDDTGRSATSHGHQVQPISSCPLKGKCALGPFLSILVIECQHKCLSVNLCQLMDKVQDKSKGMFLRLSTLFWRLMYCV
jgi:hypothetical protein